MKKAIWIIPAIIIFISLISGTFAPKESIMSICLSIMNAVCIALIAFPANPYRIKRKHDV